MLDQLEAMAIFARVVDEKSFSAAARRLGMSKSAVSKQITKLEGRLGARLLNRTTRRLSLTDIGAVFYRHCARIVEESEEAEQAVTQLQECPRGNLRMAAPMSFGTRHLAPALGAFASRYPDLRLDVHLADHFVDLVADGFDMAVRISALEDSSLIARRLAASAEVVVAAPAYLAEHGVPRHPSELARHRCLGYSNVANPSIWSLQGADGPMQIRTQPVMLANNGDLLLEAAINGCGIVYLPTFIAGAAIRAGKVVQILSDYLRPQRAIYAVYPAREHLPAKVRVMIDFLVERFGGTPYWDPCAEKLLAANGGDPGRGGAVPGRP